MRLKTDVAITGTSILWYIRIKILIVVWLLSSPPQTKVKSSTLLMFSISKKYFFPYINMGNVCSLEISPLHEDAKKPKMFLLREGDTR